VKPIVFFNNKGGVGKTSLVYHLSWMFADLGVKVIAADLDPQANLTSMFFDDDKVEKLWHTGSPGWTVYGAVEPIMKGTGDITAPDVEDIDDNLGLVPGDLDLSRFEDKLSDAWFRCLSRDAAEAAFRCFSSFHRILVSATEQRGADLVLIDVGPNLGAINRAAIISAQHVVIPLSPDLYSLQGLRNLGPQLRNWRDDWNTRLNYKPDDLDLPEGLMDPAGYVVLQHTSRLDRPTRAYERWALRIPNEYRQSVLDSDADENVSPRDDPHCLSMLKHYRSLMPMAMEARKPIFHLQPADGAIGSHMEAVLNCKQDFQDLAVKIAEKCGIELPVV